MLIYLHPNTKNCSIIEWRNNIVEGSITDYDGPTAIQDSVIDNL